LQLFWEDIVFFKLNADFFVKKSISSPKPPCPQETSALQLEVEVVLDARLPGEAGFGASNCWK
jgi:hypothetical protein